VTVGLGAGLAVGLGAGLAVGLGAGLALGLGETPGDGPALCTGEALTLRVGKLPIAFLTVLPHPAAAHPLARIAAERARLLVRRRMPGPFARLFRTLPGHVNTIHDPAVRTTQASPATDELGFSSASSVKDAATFSSGLRTSVRGPGGGS
jgi:hypothetical protein